MNEISIIMKCNFPLNKKLKGFAYKIALFIFLFILLTTTLIFAQTTDIIDTFKNTPEKDWDALYNKNKAKITTETIEELLFWVKDNSNQEDLEPVKNVVKLAIYLSQKTNYILGYAKSLMWKATIIEYLEDPNKSIITANEVLQIFKGLDDKSAIANAVLFCGALSWIKDREKALVYYRNALKSFEEINDTWGMINSYISIGQIYSKDEKKLGNRENVINCYKKALKIAEENNILNAVFCINESLILEYIQTFKNEESLDLINKTIELMAGVSDKTFETLKSKRNNYAGDDISLSRYFDRDKLILSLFKYKARCYRNEGRYQDAKKVYYDSIKKAETNGLYTELVDNYFELGTLYWTLGKEDLAIEYLNKTETVKSEKFAQTYSVFSYYITSTIYTDLKEYKKAIEPIDTGIEASQKIPLKIVGDLLRAIGYLLKADNLIKLTEYDKAEALLNNSLELINTVQEKFGNQESHLLDCYIEFGLLYREKEDFQKAIDFHNKALDVIKKYNMDSAEDSVYKELSEDYAKMGDYKSAISNMKKAISIYSQRSNTKNLWEYYYKLGTYYDDSKNKESALKYYELANNFLENISFGDTEGEYRRDILDKKIKVYEKLIGLFAEKNRIEEAFNLSEKARSRAFLDSIANQRVDYLKDADPYLAAQEKDILSQIQAVSRNTTLKERAKKEELADLKTKYDEIIEQLKIQSPQYADLISVSPVDLKKAQKLIKKGDVFLEYFIGDDFSCIFVLSCDFVKFYKINIKQDEIKAIVSDFRGKIADPSSGETWKEPSKKLFDIFIKPALKDIGKAKHLVIIPHQELHYVPFQALLGDDNKLLIDKYDITYLPSISVYKYLVQAVKNSKKTEYDLAGFALGDIKAGNLPVISGTKTEVNEISKLFVNNIEYIEDNMTLENYKEAVNKSNYLHFATHARLDNTSPFFSSLTFADGDLYVTDILNTPTSSDLVVLSACNTAIARYTTGDELVSLTRAFIYAGAPTVIASLWSVSDNSTTLLMTDFYKRFIKNKNKGLSLKEAQLEIRKNYPHPYYWAPFILIGKW